jgi:phosphoribosylglycinamide formyltransferase 1
MQIAVLASGTGSLLEALLEADLPIAVVLVDRHCRAEEIALKVGLPVAAVVREDFSSAFDRESFTREVVRALSPFDIDLVVMAGFGTILAAPAHLAYPARILNTHPALLPAFKGWHAIAEALAAGVKVTGCTVHVAELEVDEGVILAQEAVPVLADDTVESLHERIKVVERKLYPQTIRAALTVLEQGGSLA